MGASGATPTTASGVTVVTLTERPDLAAAYEEPAVWLRHRL